MLLSDWEVWDRSVLLWINQQHTPWLDLLMRLATSRLAWLPLYALWIYWLWRVYQRGLWRILVVMILLIIGTDQISTYLKNDWGRLRPCHESTVAPALHLPDGCGGRFGTVSSHAANTMGIALWLGMLAGLPVHRGHWPRFWGWSLGTYVLLVGLSRIYLGAHYPTDVLRGWVLGMILAVVALGVLLGWDFVVKARSRATGGSGVRKTRNLPYR